MSLPGNGIFVVKGEISILITAMRRGVKWSSHSHQDEELDLLMHSFQDLKDVLNKMDDLKLLDPILFLTPFLDVIRSEETTGPVTSLALSAVNKFLSYGIIDPTHASMPTVVDNIADAVTHARFVGTDQSSDGVVLMKILQVLRTLTLSPEGAALTNDSLCEIMLSCFRICFEGRLNELLRKTAEHYLKDMVQLVFMRLPQFPEDLRIGGMKHLKIKPGAIEASRKRKSSRNKNKNARAVEEKLAEGDDAQSPVVTKATSLRTNPLSTTPMTPGVNIVDMQGSISRSTPQLLSNEAVDATSPSSFPENERNGDESEPCAESNIIVNVQSPGSSDVCAEDDPNDQINSPTTEEPNFQSLDVESNEPSIPETVADANQQGFEVQEEVKEYINPRGIRFTPHQETTALIPYGIVSVREMFRFLISLCNPLDKQNTDSMIHLGLTLLTVAFEVSADNIGKYSSLLTLVKDDLCRNLFSLLNTERLSIFAADLSVSFLMFESLRTHLKFQLEFYLTKLIEIITSDSVKVTYEHKELSLDNMVQLWKVPGLVTELYLNYDCDIYCTNLYEELTKLLAKNAFPATSGIYHMHLLSLDALITVMDDIEGHCLRSKGKLEFASSNPESEGEFTNINDFIGKSSRQKVSENVPNREQLIAVKNIKKWLPMGTDYFNHKPKKGIQFLQEHGILKPDLNPHEIVTFLRENPGLEKKMIGEYISSRNNLQILEAFVKMFDFSDMRVDEALRLYLETFRLPGEAPLISLLLEHFAEHWHKSNGEPFANADAAFTLAYAVIMLNVDQHNHNVKKQNIPMTVDDFKKNLKKVNGGSDFDQELLNDIYNAIKSEEIVMPAEHTGLVKENYLWKVLLRRGMSKDGLYIHASGDAFDYDLFALIWGPIVAALSFIFDKSEDPTVYQRAIKGFESCAFISSHFGISTNLDMLILTLCKFTLFNNQPKNFGGIQFGANLKAQCALKTLFNLIHQHGDYVREGWKNVFDIFLSLYYENMLPKSYMEVEDFIDPNGKITLVCEIMQSQKQDTGLFSSLYSYMVSSSENLSKIPTPEEQEYIDIANQCIKDCNFDQVVTDSKFLHETALLHLVKALVELSRGPDVHKSLGYNYNQSVTIFFMELLLRIVIQNRDRVMSIWNIVRDHLYTLVMNASHCDYQFLLERAVIGLLRLAIRLMRNEEMSPIVLQSLRMLLLLKSSTLFRISRQISYGLYELLKTSAQNIHTSTDWSIVFTLLECVGAGAQPPKAVSGENNAEQGAKSDGEGAASSEDEHVSTDRGYTSDSELTRSPKHVSSSRPQSPLIVTASSPVTVQSNTGGWIVVGKDTEVQPVVGRTLPAEQYNLALERNLGPHDRSALVKCCESLAFLVRDVAHITPYNFDNCIHCIRTFVEASLNGTKRSRRISNRESAGRKKLGGRRRDHAQTRRSPITSSPDEESEDEDDIPSGYHQISIQLLDLMHTLHTRTAQIFRWWAEEGGEVGSETSLWTQGWCPLLQGIARLCCDVRRQVRMSAITYLQRALLVHDLQTLTGPEWEACFHRVLFPLLSLLLQPIGPSDAQFLEETRMRAATVLSKVFLHHLTPLLSLPTFTQLWITILDFMDKYMHADNSDLLYEAIPESLKNMLLVMDSAKVFEGQEGPGQLWSITWERIGRFLPHMKEELFRERDQENLKEEVVQVQHQTEQPSITTIQHNIENATRSSIILLPPSSEPNIASPLFAHLGQMVSTPIGAPTYAETSPTFAVPNSPILQTTQPQIATQPTSGLQIQPTVPYAMPNLLVNSSNEGHTFPVLYNKSFTESQPVSLYSQYIDNPYNCPPPQNTTATDNDNSTVTQNDTTTDTNSKNIAEDNNSNYESNISEIQPNNIFQSANYFCSGSEFIPPGSEILFASEQKNQSSLLNNVPIISSVNINQ
ncbi:hypothetical protein PPYR_12913 [Photinus pyralis]|uniref:SEC7 domain-containing protein n=1 Tax=Photinus pyralis TaxID=7054 RepID=A0A5N4A7J9_PHOPY|nr:Golgi-specific brefeldin A-resistance guanine nucleotide exchange factor 1 [Photinus pyralis]KAB0793293.1 hypothetical protein PPYR_12913 [Photinus pyralis]